MTMYALGKIDRCNGFRDISANCKFPGVPFKTGSDVCRATVARFKDREWTYHGPLGPIHWHLDYPNCGGLNQSPIDIDASGVTLNTSLSTFVLNGYEQINNVNMSIQNNGHTVEVDLKRQSMTVSGGGLPGVYKAKQFHFHWGAENGRGSEHYLHGNYFPIEMHIIHYSSKYNDVMVALNKTDGLAVFGFLFKIGEENSLLNDLIKYFKQITNKYDIVGIPQFPLRSFLPENLHSYYRYYGSLSTPPCFESVIWTIFTTPIELSEDQMHELRSYLHNDILHKTEDDESDDFRPIQSLNGRSVCASDREALDALDVSSSDSNHKTNILMFIYLAISLLILKYD